MTATVEVMATMEVMTEDPIFISSAMAMAGAMTPNIIAIEELRAVDLDTPVAATADMAAAAIVVVADMAAEGTAAAVEAMVEAEDDIEPA